MSPVGLLVLVENFSVIKVSAILALDFSWVTHKISVPKKTKDLPWKPKRLKGSLSSPKWRFLALSGIRSLFKLFSTLKLRLGDQVNK